MAIKFKSNGILECNSIQRNWGVTPNLIRYGCGCGKFFDGNPASWADSDFNDFSGYNTGSIYTTKCGFHWARITGMVGQPLVQIEQNHIYYFSTWYKTSGPTAFVIRNGGTDRWGLSLITDDTWRFSSRTFKADTTIAHGNWRSYSSGANWVVWVGSGTCCFTRTILFDITAMFGSTIADTFYTGNDTSGFWKTWCDNYLRENRTFVTANVEGTHYLKPSGTGGGTNSKADYNKSSGEFDTSWDSEWYIAYNTGTGSEALLYFDKLNLVQNQYYYAQTYFMPNTNYAYQGKSYEWYWPEAEPNMGNQPLLVTQSKYGNAKDWRITSDYAIRSNWSSGNYSPRFDVNNNGTDLRVYTHAFGGIHPMGTASSNGWFYYYNTSRSSSVGPTSTGVNRYFFDCWADGYSQPFIHCPSPLAEDRKIKFNSTYDIICNDILIEPEINKVYFDEIGRVHCKGLSSTIESFV
jgi:hypothetical protein